MLNENVTLVTTKDEQQIAVWQVCDDLPSNRTDKSQNVLLLHGAFSDKRVCMGIASYLTKFGHTCYIMEWRGRGKSTIPKDDFNFETVAHYDVDATFDYLFNDLNITNLHCITHSGGGLCLTMFLAKNKSYIDRINSISMFACQAYGAVLNPKCYAKILTLNYVTKTLGYLPAKRFKMGPINESHYTMKQWYRWNLNKNYASSLPEHRGESFDYRDHMIDISIPIYSICAKGDSFIAPPICCEQYMNDFENPNNQFKEFSIANGNLADYDHTKLIVSLNAAKEVWPTVLKWIEQHS